jgi:hypothetical protein
MERDHAQEETTQIDQREDRGASRRNENAEVPKEVIS